MVFIWVKALKKYFSYFNFINNKYYLNILNNILLIKHLLILLW